MTLFKNKYRIESTRLKGWDYSNDGAYFFTICIKDRRQLLGKIVDGNMRGNENAEIIRECWKDLPEHYSNCVLDEFVVMPNHVHGIIIIDNNLVSSKRYSLSEMLRGFKTFSSRRINELRGTVGMPFWQLGYYDHVIRDEIVLNEKRQYIKNNPMKFVDGM